MDNQKDHPPDDLIQQIENKHGNVFYAPRGWPSKDQYPPSEEAFNIVLEALQNSTLFVLYYPEKVTSGALVELGIAIALKKPVLIYTRDVENITYFMRDHKDLVTDSALIIPWIDNHMTYDVT